MRRHPVHTLALALWPLSLPQARLLYSGPEDLYAFPKSRVAFLNNLPVSNDTAQRWLNGGLRGGEPEFLDQFWEEHTWYSRAALKEIGSSDAESPQEVPHAFHSEVPDVSLQHMKMGPDNEFLCLILSARDRSPPAPDNFDGDEALRNSWSLLQPLSGRCLYHRQSWFTYSYCHNREIRQFKELPHSHPHPPGGYEPVEDQEWEAFTLGRAPSASQPSADVVASNQLPQAAGLEVGQGPSSRYLVQRWGDGTFCDKTGKPREVEVQFHCSMTMTDSILFVREAKTCSYILVVQTPRLCGEPGFKSRHENHDESLVRCREIINPAAAALQPPSESTHLEQRKAEEFSADLSESDYPLYLLGRQSRFPIPSPAPQQSSLGDGTADKDDPWDAVWKRTLEALTKNSEMFKALAGNQQVFFDRGENGEVVIEIVEEIPMEGSADGAAHGEMSPEEYARLASMLRKAGFDVKGEAETKNDDGKERAGGDESRNTKDEL
ncbi:hypothetical protein F5I97DRAFT_1947704 [Phlebopus sp. FC_14]|nr:hypothetical protein F5I97DRAFT_1947704 [Phlebopus sp. FC_14]